MPTKKIIMREFSGGIGTTSEKKDIVNSASFIKNLNPFEDPTYLTMSRVPTKISGSTVVGLPTWAEDGSPYDTNRYFVDEGGNIYKETSLEVVSNLRTVSGCAGEGLKVFDDFLYYALSKELGRYGKLSGTPAFNDAFLSDGVMDLDQSGGGSGFVYATTTSVNEGATHRQTFTPDNDPLKTVVINVSDTGDDPTWTVTVHDYYDNLIGSKTIAYADMSTGDMSFIFSTPLRLVIGNEYHFHVTTSTTTGAPAVVTDVTTDLEGADFSTLFGVLIDATFHPMVSIEDVLVIGNERYLAVWDQATYEPNKIALEPGYEVRAMAKFEEFVVAAAFKGGNMEEAEDCRLYFWDGIVAGEIVSYNYFTDVPVGVANSLYNFKGELIGVYGNTGKIYKGSDPFLGVVNQVPKLARGKKVEVYPGAISDYNGRLLVGISASTDDTALEQGVYEYGHQSDLLPEAFNFPYLISTGTTTGTTLKIGLVKRIGTDIYIGWRDGAGYGLDKISVGDGASASGTWESLIYDGGNPEEYFLPINLIIQFEPLTTGQSVTPKYKLDRAASWTTGDTEDTVGATSVELPIFNRCKEMQWGINLVSSSNTFLKITGIILEYEPLTSEE